MSDLYNINDFTADYTLSKNGDSTKLEIVETFDMTFPEANEKHGPVRELPYTNQAGENLITKNGKNFDLTVLMDGEPFPIAKTETGQMGYDRTVIHYIGRSSSYLHGKHTFTLKYTYENVILDSEEMQELYWNANGTGWSSYTFSKVTANLHIADADALAAVLPDLTSCYVGKYGIAGSERCEITKTADGYSFSAEDLGRNEGLTYAVDFKPGTYSIPIPRNDFTILLLGSLVCAVIIGIIALVIRSCKKKVGNKRNVYKSTFVKPEYESPRELTVAEGEQLLMKGAKKSYVATLLELAISKKVQIIKGEPTKILKKDTWKVNVLTTEGLTEPQKNMLKLLAGSHEVEAGEIEIKRRTATSYMASVARSYATKAVSMLHGKGLTEKSSATRTGTGTTIFIAVVFFVTFGLWTCVLPLIFISDYTANSFASVVGATEMSIIIPGLIALTWITVAVCAVLKDKYGWYTEEGLRAERELEGLKLYVGMAEADRLKFLQSVKGADTSDKGIVKLYEKLLPWAALFGQEESWLKELGKYYQTMGDPYWCSDISMLDVAMFHAMTSSVTSSVVSTSSYTSSGSGGSSSGFGGGGGGFSGGGGGGGGGGSW